MIKKIGILASYNGSGFETIQKAIIEKKLNAKVVVVIAHWNKPESLQSVEYPEVACYSVDCVQILNWQYF